MGQNIVHTYFKKELENHLIMVMVNPHSYSGKEINIAPDGSSSVRELQFDEEIFQDLEADGFIHCNPLEFHLYLSGLKK